MRKLQKIFAVSATTAMTLAMGVSAFADTTVTYHFYNASKWDKVGAWVKQSIDWKDDCLPLDKCVLKDTIDGTAPHEPIWPGATMEAEGNDWYKVTCTYTDFSKGSMMIFNNYVGDSVATDTTSDADIAKIQAAGITTDSNGKHQTPNIMIKKGSEAASDYYINYDGNESGSLIVIGKSDMVTTTPPENYGNSLKGDVNSDGNINSKDVVLFSKFVAGYSVKNFDKNSADMNDDGKINSKDFVLLLKIIAGYTL